ncbi:MAG: hypothetical protein G8237_15140 [Magnetococcales bacterium]|nr:hypothetical protein [Magnetococcales bacterium]
MGQNVFRAWVESPADDFRVSVQPERQQPWKRVESHPVVPASEVVAVPTPEDARGAVGMMGPAGSLVPARQRIYAELVRSAFVAADASEMGLPVPVSGSSVAFGGGGRASLEFPSERVVALLPGMARALAEALRSWADAQDSEHETLPTVTDASDKTRALAADQARLLIGQARTLLAATLTMAEEMIDPATRQPVA